jgi:integral membrane protein
MHNFNSFICYNFSTKFKFRNHMLNIFRKLSLIEGFSLIVLLFMAMPAKYHFGFFDIVWYAGMVHGLLWISYFLGSLLVSHKQNWSVGFWLVVLFASVIPFACIFLDKKLKEEHDFVSVNVVS